MKPYLALIAAGLISSSCGSKDLDQSQYPVIIEIQSFGGRYIIMDCDNNGGVDLVQDGGELHSVASRAYQREGFKGKCPGSGALETLPMDGHMFQRANEILTATKSLEGRLKTEKNQ